MCDGRLASCPTARRRGQDAARRGWTAVELLVVVGIVAVVVGTVLTSAWAAREYARKVVCVSRLHMLHTAIMAYTADHDRRLPVVTFFDYSRHPDSWSPAHAIKPSEFAPPWPNAPEPPRWYSLRVSLGDYVDDPAVFFCPSHPHPLRHWAQFPKWCWMSYTVDDGIAAMRLDELTWPPEYAALINCPYPCGHFGRQHFLFVDGHVAGYRWPPPIPFMSIRVPWSRARRALRLP